MTKNFNPSSPGGKFRAALNEELPLQIVGVINAYAAIMAGYEGFRALYLSGAGVANASYGLPDLGMTTLDNVLIDASRITASSDLPLLVDIDTGWGNTLMIRRTIRSLERVGAAAVHIEDQPFEKRCGHREKKQVIPTNKMVDRLKAALDARQDSSFVIMARTDAFQSEGLPKTLDRCLAYEACGADMHFIEAVPDLKTYKIFTSSLKRPVLANVTEFGQTPLFTTQELATAGVKMALYPLSAWRAMNLAALKVYHEIRTTGSQKAHIDQMQTREELYGFLNYETFESIADAILEEGPHDN